MDVLIYHPMKVDMMVYQHPRGGLDSSFWLSLSLEVLVTAIMESISPSATISSAAFLFGVMVAKPIKDSVESFRPAVALGT